MTKKPRTLGDALLLGLQRALLWTASFGLAYLVARHVIVPGIAFVHPSTPPVADPLSHVHRLMTMHGCWQGSAPKDVKYPGHVVVTIDGHARYGGARLVKTALAQVFGGKQYPGRLTVWGFCR